MTYLETQQHIRNSIRSSGGVRPAYGRGAARHYGKRPRLRTWWLRKRIGQAAYGSP